jgi:thiamine biosynthesis lipoprotein ApbE
MKTAHLATNGLFNPTLLPLHIEADDMSSLIDDKQCTVTRSATPHQDLHDIVELSDSLVSIPKTMTLDVGGMAKGFAADLLIQELLSRGAVSASVNIGGDAVVFSLATGEPLVQTCSVIANSARTAEVMAKYVLLSPNPRTCAEAKDLAAFWINADGSHEHTDTWTEFQL